MATPLGLKGTSLRQDVGTWIGDDYILGVWSGDQGVEYVRMHALEK